MTRTDRHERFEALLAEYFDGTIDAADQAELEGLVEQDRDRAQQFIDMYRQSRILEATHRPLDATFTRAVLDAIERDRGPFVRSVMVALERRRGRRWAWPAMAAAALIVVVGAFGLSPDSLAIAHVTAAGPHVTVRRGGEAMEVRADFVLHSGDTLTTPSGESARLKYLGEATRLDVVALSELTLRDTAQGKQVELRRGEVHAKVAHQPAGRPMIMRSAVGRAEVIGTRLTLSAVNSLTRLEVHEGLVRLTRDRDGASLDIPANHFTLADNTHRLRSELVREPPATLPTVTRLALIDVDDPQRKALAGFERLEDGAVIDLGVLGSRGFNLQAQTDPEQVGSVRFALDGNDDFHTEILAPYTVVAGNYDGTQRPWNPAPGRHTITATPYNGSWGNGGRGQPLTVTFTVLARRQ